MNSCAKECDTESEKESIIDTSWLDDFENVEQFYSGLYTEEIQTISIYFLYVNKNKELFHIKKNNIEIDNSELSKEHLVFLLNNNHIYNKKKFRPMTLLKYNINLKPQNMIYYLKHPEKYDFLSFEKNINTILWDDSIPLFHELNSLFVIYTEYVKTNNTTKKIYIKSKSKRKTKHKYT